MEAVARRPAHIEAWHRKARGEPVDLVALLDGFSAAVDWPVAGHALELAERLPEARVLLSVRDPEAWYRSVQSTIYRWGEVLRHRPHRWMMEATPVGGFQAMVDAVVWNGTFEGRFHDRDHALAVYRRHVERVRDTVPAERLLVFDVREGWDPLCRFLEVPVPGVPFPRTNSTRAMRQRLAVVRALGWAVGPVAAPVAWARQRQVPPSS